MTSKILLHGAYVFSSLILVPLSRSLDGAEIHLGKYDDTKTLLLSRIITGRVLRYCCFGCMCFGGFAFRHRHGGGTLSVT